MRYMFPTDLGTGRHSTNLMNKKQIQKIKKVVGYNPDLPEHRRLLRRLKKEYQNLPKDRKVNLIEDLKKTFGETE